MLDKIKHWILEKIMNLGLDIFNIAHKMFDWIPGAKNFINNLQNLTLGLIALGIVLVILFFAYPYILQVFAKVIFIPIKIILKIFVKKIENSIIETFTKIFNTFIKIFLYLIAPQKIVSDLIIGYFRRRKKRKKELERKKIKIRQYFTSSQNNILLQQENINNIINVEEIENKNETYNNPII